MKYNNFLNLTKHLYGPDDTAEFILTQLYKYFF